MRRVLILYDTVSGATNRVADIMAEKLRGLGASADVVPLSSAKLPGTYDVLVLGCPLRFGRPTRRFRRFVLENRKALSHTKISLFFTCLVLMTIEGRPKPAFPVFTDPALVRPPKKDRYLNMVEYSHTLPYAALRLEKTLSGLAPETVGFFRGALDFSRLPVIDRLLMLGLMIFIRETDAGDFVNPGAISTFAETLLF